MSKGVIQVKRSDIPALVSHDSKEAFFEGIRELSGSVQAIQRAGKAFARISDDEWKICKSRIPGEARRWAQNARDVIKKGLHPAFALMAGDLGRKARKLPAAEQVRILQEPVEVAILSDDGRIVDKEMKMASELTGPELDRVIAEDRTSAWVAEPRAQAARVRARLKMLEAKEEKKSDFEIKRAGYVVNRKGVTLKSKTLSFGQFNELAKDVAKIRKELR